MAARNTELPNDFPLTSYEEQRPDSRKEEHNQHEQNETHLRSKKNESDLLRMVGQNFSLRRRRRPDHPMDSLL